MACAIGPAAGEVPIVASVYCGQAPAINNVTQTTIRLPVRVPRGSRVSCRITNANASPPAGATVLCSLFESVGRYTPAGRLVPIGANVAASKGVDITASNTWTEVTAATTEPFAGLVMTFGLNDALVNTISNASAELGIGTSGAERSIDRIAYGTINVEWMSVYSTVGPVFTPIPVGTRIAVRSSNATGDSLSTVVQGVPYS